MPNGYFTRWLNIASEESDTNRYWRALRAPRHSRITKLAPVKTSTKKIQINDENTQQNMAKLAFRFQIRCLSQASDIMEIYPNITISGHSLDGLFIKRNAPELPKPFTAIQDSIICLKI